MATLIILFLPWKTQNHMFLSPLYQQKKIKNYQNFFVKDYSKGFLLVKVYWNEYKTRSDNKNATNEYGYFLERNFVEVNKLFVLVYLNKDKDVKRFKTQRYYLPKDIIKNYNVIINGKDFYVQAVDSNYKMIWRN